MTLCYIWPIVGNMSHRSVVRLIGLVAEAAGRSPHTIGRLAAGSGDFYLRLKKGRDLTTRRAAHAIQYLSDNWPEDLERPSDISRPEPPRTEEVAT